MQRVPKYKAFLKKRNKIIKVTKINFNEKYIEYLDEKNNTIISTFDEIELLEFTGLYDVKNIPIYEQDEVIFYNKKHVILFDEEKASFIAYDEEFEEKVGFINGNNKRMEVIGNVFMNKGFIE